LSGLPEAMLRLRGRFLARAASDLDDLKLWTREPPDDPERLRYLVHRVAGAAGTFGYDSLSDRAKIAEDALITGAPDRNAALVSLIDELGRVTADAGS
jgi:HPt (histidine-containing phosphotransfer) domain-containing protein